MVEMEFNDILLPLHHAQQSDPGWCSESGMLVCTIISIRQVNAAILLVV